MTLPAPTVAAAAAVATSPAVSAAASGSEVDPKYMKYYRMKKAGLPEGAIIQAFGRDNVPVPPDFFAEGGPSPIPASASAAAAAAAAPRPAGGIAAAAAGGGASAAAAAAEAAKPKGPQKPVVKVCVAYAFTRFLSRTHSHTHTHKPNVKMRGLFWTKIQPDQLDGTIWKDLKDDKVKLEVQVLESKFQAVEAKAMPAAGGAGELRTWQCSVSPVTYATPHINNSGWWFIGSGGQGKGAHY